MQEEQVKEIGLHEGQNSRDIRKEIRNESQQDVASRIPGFYQQKISRMENKRNLSEADKVKIAAALGVDVEDIKYLDKDRAMVKIFKENNTIAHDTATNASGLNGGDNNISDNAEMIFGGETYKIINPIDKVSELYERLNKKDQYIMYLETLLEGKDISFEDKKKKIFGDSEE
ncbi:MAG: helix-turn-helix domain-containing protein [Tannerella sp.]|jgi:hypothetical protein|nr:helix-turn-helix domain-containing protein [Tannerella sp.]